ncbi:MAG TPA: demethoxyubiquinone hydroxylase family protein [Legionellales bacterium]|nr:demethoxyubiquinone hydroxylase family protein [Legionellales bacterium]
MTPMRNWLDKGIIQFDKLLRVLVPVWPKQSQEDNPAQSLPTTHLNSFEKHQSAAMMRVNLAGEVAAQGLYRGQMLLARKKDLKDYFLHAADEELSHYAWCYQRLKDLDARPSVFNPIWYCGAFMIGLVASMIGDKTSLGFVIATEEQVGQHLAGHLQLLPKDDLQSRAIVAKMYADELSHAEDAFVRGGQRLPREIQQMMHWTAQIMIQASRLI